MTLSKESTTTQPQNTCSACSAARAKENENTGKNETKDGKGTCPLNPLPYVYALGQVEARFPSRSIEKEFAQLIERSQSSDLSDQQAFYTILSQPQNRYLAKKLSWVFSIEGVPIYILLPGGPGDLNSLLSAIQSPSTPLDRTVVIGRKGPVAPPEMCGLEVPMVLVDQFDRLQYKTFMKSARPRSVSDKKFEAVAEETFQRMMQIAINTGSTNKHRALNYLAVRCPDIYSLAAEKFERSFTLTSVEALRSRLSDSRKIVSVVFTFTGDESRIVEKHFVRVDVSDEFPFIVTKMAPYYDR